MFNVNTSTVDMLSMDGWTWSIIPDPNVQYTDVVLKKNNVHPHLQLMQSV